jgi:hypothetical protein
MIQNEELTDLSESVVAVIEKWQDWIRGKITAMQRPRNVVLSRSKSGTSLVQVQKWEYVKTPTD